MHDAKAFGWKVGQPEHDWEAMVETVQNHVHMLNFRYRVGLKSAQVWCGLLCFGVIEFGRYGK